MNWKVCFFLFAVSCFDRPIKKNYQNDGDGISGFSLFFAEAATRNSLFSSSSSSKASSSPSSYWMTSTSSSSTSSYESVRALDEFGNAKQLEYANRAAQQRGSLVVILSTSRCCCDDGDYNETDEDDDHHHNCCWIVRVAGSSSSGGAIKGAAHHRRSATSSSSGNSNGVMVQRLSLPDWAYDTHHIVSSSNGYNKTIKKTTTCKNPTMNSCYYMVCTGLQGDARWLTDRLRMYMSRLWNVQQSSPPSMMSSSSSSTGMAVATATASLMRLFWQHPVDIAMASPTLRSVVASSSSSRTDSWARPMGLQVAILAVGAHHDYSATATAAGTLPLAPPHVFHIDAAGNIECKSMQQQRHVESSQRQNGIQILCCMGSQHERVQETMERALQKVNPNDSSDNNKDADARMEAFILRTLTEALGSLEGRTVHVQCIDRDGILQPERILKT